MDTTLDKESIICPVCYRVPGKEVYQCRNGHVFCDQCSAKMETCPECRESIRGEKRGRNRFMERTLDGLELDCPFTDKGCKRKKMKRAELANHRSSCMFGKVVPLCELLQLPGRGEGTCNFKVDFGNLKRVSTHLATAHRKFPLIETKRDGKIVESFSQFFALGDAVYTRVLKFDAYADNIIFMAVQQDGFVSWVFLDLSENQCNGPQMQIKLWSDEAPKIKWTIPVFPVMEAEKHTENPIVKTFIPSLKEILEPFHDDLDFDIYFQLET